MSEATSNTSSRTSGDLSPKTSGDVSPSCSSDTSPAGIRDGSRCSWCRRELPTATRKDALFCGQRCRQTAFRLRRRRTTAARAARPMRFAYADPPYPGTARKYYAGEASYAGEVDHPALIAELERRRFAGELDGWALSTSARALRFLLPLCPAEVRVCPWVKPGAPNPQTLGPHNTWEPLLVVGGRRRRVNRRDWLRAHPARGGGQLPGRKPIAFCAWLFDMLGMEPGDALEDLFPGTGVIGRAWAEVVRGVELSPEAFGDLSPLEDDDRSSEVLGDASPAAAGDA